MVSPSINFGDKLRDQANRQINIKSFEGDIDIG